MNPILAAVALAVVAGAVAAVSLRDARVVVVSLAATLVVSSALADPLPESAGLAARLIGAVLAGYLLWMAARDHPTGLVPPAPTEGSRIGWPAEALLAAAAAVAGFAAHGLGAPAAGPALASAVGFAVAALSITPVITGRDVFRVGLGLILLLDGTLLVRVALDGTPSPLEQLLSAGLLVALAGTVASLAWTARRDGSGGFGFGADGPWRSRAARLPEAHRVTSAPAATDTPADRSSPSGPTPRPANR